MNTRQVNSPKEALSNSSTKFSNFQYQRRCLKRKFISWEKRGRFSCRVRREDTSCTFLISLGTWAKCFSKGKIKTRGVWLSRLFTLTQCLANRKKLLSACASLREKGVFHRDPWSVIYIWKNLWQVRRSFPHIFCSVAERNHKKHSTVACNLCDFFLITEGYCVSKNVNLSSKFETLHLEHGLLLAMIGFMKAITPRVASRLKWSYLRVFVLECNREKFNSTCLHGRENWMGGNEGSSKILALLRWAWDACSTLWELH
jgi:hypothetical protein